MTDRIPDPGLTREEAERLVKDIEQDGYHSAHGGPGMNAYKETCAVCRADRKLRASLDQEGEEGREAPRLFQTGDVIKAKDAGMWVRVTEVPNQTPDTPVAVTPEQGDVCHLEALAKANPHIWPMPYWKLTVGENGTVEQKPDAGGPWVKREHHERRVKELRALLATQPNPGGAEGEAPKPTGPSVPTEPAKGEGR